jgi:dihydroorotate dehydrogenase electron transfer subunit
MKQGFFTVTENRPLTGNVMLMRMAGDTSAITAPGQFVNIRLDGYFLRRPISVCDWDDETITIIYKILGHGTAYMRTLGMNSRLDVLSGLGNGFELSDAGTSPLLIGGGVGTPPM